MKSLRRKHRRKHSSKHSGKHPNNTALLSSTKKAVTQTRTRVKKQLLSFLYNTKKNIKRMTTKVDKTVAKKISSLTKRRF